MEKIIIIDPSKTFNLKNPSSNLEPRPKYLEIAKIIFRKVRYFDLATTKKVYNLSDQKAQEVYQMHQKHGEKLYQAIDLYAGQVFQQVNWADYDREWVNQHVLIIDALYGLIKPYDLIAPYRLDFKTQISANCNLKEIWTQKINQELANKTIINLASLEFSKLIIHPLTTIPLVENKQIKIARGKTLNQWLKKHARKRNDHN